MGINHGVGKGLSLFEGPIEKTLVSDREAIARLLQKKGVMKLPSRS
jgi:hypothetical protein